MELHDRLTAATHGDPPSGGDADRALRERARALLLLMRAFQSGVAGPVLRHFARPQNILEVGMAFWSSTVVFTELAARRLSTQEIVDRLSWQPQRFSQTPGAVNAAAQSDLAKVASAIIAVADQTPAPTRLALGPDAYDYIREELTAGIAELESLKDISCGVAVDGPRPVAT
jgi:hypothetical protein